MPFCCIAIVAVAILYFTFLSLRQLFLGTFRDLKVSSLPAPPRALTGNRAQPVYGHTRLFTRCGGDCALVFPPEMHECRWLPTWFSRALGECFSIFIWGQWRVVVKGSERTRKILEQSDLSEGWAWNAPVTLLGRSCLPLLDDPEEADFLSSLLATPLSHRNIARYAPEFAEIAEKFVDDLIAGEFQKRKEETNHFGAKPKKDELNRLEEGRTSEMSISTMGADKSHKIKWSALRSFTFDLIDGPVLRTNKWNRKGEQGEQVASSEIIHDTILEEEKAEKADPTRSTMLLWMERMKAGMCVIKMTFGAEWMYVWMLNEYGRAVNGRMHIEKVISAHIADRSKRVPVQRGAGLITRDPVATPFPLFTMAENMLRRNENVLGAHGKANFTRPRSRSAPDISDALDSNDSDWMSDYNSLGAVPPPPSEDGGHSPMRQRCDSSPVVLQTARKHVTRNNVSVSRPVHSVLETIMRQHDSQGRGMTEAVLTELSVLLWMIMDAGNAWTAMGLHLLSVDQSACEKVQQELNSLVGLYGNDKLFSPRVMAEMKSLDALVWEAIRLTPPFLGGMKITSETVEFPQDGVQIPKNTNVIFCQPTKDDFNLSRAMGKKPESLSHCYPCVELHGFLPFRGLEVPLMVLQTKVFLAAFLQRCSPYISKKRTFIRRVKAVIYKSALVDRVPHERGQESSHGNPPSSHSSISPSGRGAVPDLSEYPVCGDEGAITQTEAMKLFTKIPFPEPRRVLNFIERDAIDVH